VIPDCDTRITRTKFGFSKFLPEIPEQKSGFGYFGFGFGYSGFGFRVTGFLPSPIRIAIELGVRRLDARGDSHLVIDQVMKNSHCCDPKMEAYCDEIRRLEDKFYGLEVNHIA
jgi:hypothetical protein